MSVDFELNFCEIANSNNHNQKKVYETKRMINCNASQLVFVPMRPNGKLENEQIFNKILNSSK